MRIPLLFVVLLVAGLLPSLTFAQEPMVHPIEKALEACIEKDPSTAGTVRCEDRAFTMWDKELNKNYLSLMAKLDPADKALLKAAQLAWLKQRDAEFKLIDSIYGSLQGSMYIPMHVDRKKGVIKSRAEELSFYLGLMSENEP